MQTEKRSRQLSQHKVQRRFVVRIALHWLLFLVTSLAVLCVWQLLLLWRAPSTSSPANWAQRSNRRLLSSWFCWSSFRYLSGIRSS